MSRYSFSRVVDRLEALGRAPKVRGKKLSARCPAHDDQSPSFSATCADDGSASLTCHTGCDFASIVAALGLTAADVVSDAGQSTGAPRASRRTGRNYPTPEAAKEAVLRQLRRTGVPFKVTGEWSYCDGRGDECLRILRFDGRSADEKEYRPIHPTKSGLWKIGDPEGKLPLYGLKELSAAGANATVWVVEGEKCADVARTLGAVATSSAHGANSASRSDWSPLAGRRVAIFPDNDDAGRRYATGVAVTLLELDSRADVRVVNLPGLGDGGDIANFVKLRATAGASADAIRREIEHLVESSPKLAPAPASDTSACSLSSGRRRAKTVQLHAAALHGIVGEWVRLVEPHTEADAAALLFQFLAAFGNVVGRGPHVCIESDEHHGNLFVVVVGRSSKGRKGTSWGYVRTLFKAIDPVWFEKRVASGLSSGEGLIHAIRDSEGEDDGAPKDKRLLVHEGEFASVLRVLQREGSTLSAIARSAWDGTPLRTLTKISPMVATGTHISMVGHSTSAEVQRYLDRTEMANGFANRMLWVYVGRSKKLPFGGKVPAAELTRIRERLRLIVAAAQQVGRVEFDEQARKEWEIAYDVLSEERPGMLGAVTGRAEAQVLRLALLYALLDGAQHIRPEHLAAALACWRYADDSARIIFGDSTGSPIADRILGALRDKEAGLDRTDISSVLGRNVNRTRLDDALELLLEFGLATSRYEKTGGRAREVFEATKETKEVSDAVEVEDLPSSVSFNLNTDVTPKADGSLPGPAEAQASPPPITVPEADCEVSADPAGSPCACPQCGGDEFWWQPERGGRAACWVCESCQPSRVARRDQ